MAKVVLLGDSFVRSEDDPSLPGYSDLMLALIN